MFKISELLDFLKRNNFISDMPIYNIDFEIKRFASLAHPAKDSLCWAKKKLKIDDIPDCAVLICLIGQEENFDRSVVMVHVSEPRRAFGAIVDNFYPEKFPIGISGTAIIDPSVFLGKNVYIGPRCVIGPNCVVGNDTRLDANVTLYNNVRIGCRCHISSGAVIGADGHGYVKIESGKYHKIRHMGGVCIGDDVDIGVMVTIDRGTLDDTTIGNNTKIDNKTGIAHNVIIGDNCMICGDVGIAGSTIIGNNCWIAPNVKIINGIAVANDVTIGLCSVVYHSVTKSNVTLFGNPAKIFDIKFDKY